VREDALLPLVERFFAERIFGPMRLDKLAKQLRSHQRDSRRKSQTAHRRLRAEVADVDERIGRQIEGLERGIEPELVGRRIAELREAKERAEIELRGLDPAAADSEPAESLGELLGRIPDLSQALYDAPRELKRQVFEAFGLRIAYDKVDRRIEVSATISEAIAQALQNARDLPGEVSSVAHRDIAGAGFEPATFGL
jgi:site-specific DNA recombinase